MSKSRFTITGDKELRKTLFDLGEKTQAILLEASKEASEVIRQAASDRAPVDQGVLKDNIYAELTGYSRTKVTISVGPGKAAYYGMWIEMGTKQHGPQPYLRPAAEERAEESFQVFSASVRQALDGVK